MYVRPPNYRYPNSVRVPDNYAGNAFRPQSEPAPTPPDEPKEELAAADEVVEPMLEAKSEPAKKDEVEASLLEPRGFRLRLGSLFGKGGSIGTEELLILALILLLADSESDSFDDIILFLALLFFIR